MAMRKEGEVTSLALLLPQFWTDSTNKSRHHKLSFSHKAWFLWRSIFSLLRESVQVLKQSTWEKCVFLYIIYEWFSNPRDLSEGVRCEQLFLCLFFPSFIHLFFSWRLFGWFDTCSVEPTIHTHVHIHLCVRFQPHSSAIQMFNCCHRDEQVSWLFFFPTVMIQCLVLFCHV